MNIVPLIPAYKPDDSLLQLIKGLEHYPQIVVINDGSGPEFDGVFQALPAEVTLIQHEVNRGKGAALKTGMAYIQEHFPDCLGLVTVDADGQHRLADVERVCQELTAHPNALVLGVRSFTRSGIPLRSRVGNIVTRLLFFALVGKFIRDTQTGLRAIPTSYIPELLQLKPDRYEYELEVLLACRRRPVRQVTIETVYIDENRSSHFDPIGDSLKIYKTLIRCRLRSLKNTLSGRSHRSS